MNREAVQASIAALRMNQEMTMEQFKWLRCQDAILELLAPEKKVVNAPRTLDEFNRMLSLAVYDDLDFMEAEVLATINLIRDRTGVLSLTERYDSLPMWVHYPAKAQGYVAVIENLENSFQGDETGSLNIPKRVFMRSNSSG